MVSFLLARGAKSSARSGTKDGERTPADIAKSLEVKSLLLEGECRYYEFLIEIYLAYDVDSALSKLVGLKKFKSFIRYILMCSF